MKLLVILQNAWRRKAGPNDTCWIPSAPERSKKLWEKALWKSLSGKKLKQMIPDNMEVVVTNASPRIGNVSSSHFPMEPEYVLAELDENLPDVVLLCGKEAEKAFDLIFDWAEEKGRKISVVLAPHPAWRALSSVKMSATKAALSTRTD